MSPRYRTVMILLSGTVVPATGFVLSTWPVGPLPSLPAATGLHSSWTAFRLAQAAPLSRPTRSGTRTDGVAVTEGVGVAGGKVGSWVPGCGWVGSPEGWGCRVFGVVVGAFGGWGRPGAFRDGCGLSVSVVPSR